MTIFERGDIALISYPSADSRSMHLRPVMVLHAASAGDAGISVVPITPDPAHLCPSILVTEGSFEAARMGLVTSGYLNACSGVVVDRQFMNRKIGRCPWKLLNEFLVAQRRPSREWTGTGAERYLPTGV